MRRIVLIVPGLTGEPSFLRQKLPALERMAELGTLFRISPMPQVETPEALYLGLTPEEGQLRQGPLTISALKADPPERSIHFHLSLMTFDDGYAKALPFQVSGEDQGRIIELAKKLDTKLLTLVEGEGGDHGLVWEALGDLRTTPAAEVAGKPIREHLPEGDAEVALRRYIDDSINLLTEIELNQRRMDEELPPLNLLWPWGEGVRSRVPNLALRRGEPALVLSNSMRLAGLSRLAGYRHIDRREFGYGTNTRLEAIRSSVLSESVSLILIDAFSGFRERQQLEEGEWLAKEIDQRLLGPLFDEALKNPTRIAVLTDGLGVTFETGNAGSNAIPFDERAFDERSLPVRSLHDTVAAAVG